MPFTLAQNLLIKAAILADPALAAQPNTYSGNAAIRDALHLQAAPAFTVWKSRVPITEVGDNFAGTELASLQATSQDRLRTIAMYSDSGINPSLSDRRAFFDDIFSGPSGVLTRAKLLILWKRLSSRLEKILATGTGTDAAPATLGYEGTITPDELETARLS